MTYTINILGISEDYNAGPALITNGSLILQYKKKWLNNVKKIEEHQSSLPQTRLISQKILYHM